MPASSLPDALGNLAPPPRFAEARFATYQAETDGQKRALEEARALAERLQQPPSLGDRLRSWTRRMLPIADAAPPRGLYFVGPAGTGKTHLLAAIYHRLAPNVRCAFVHSSDLFRAARHPERLAKRLAQKDYRVLMLDEVELDDAANEARLAHFLRVLSGEGVALAATSNARPGEFMSRHVSGGGRHRRFLTDALAGHCEIIFVEGADHRRRIETEQTGCIVVGPPEAARARLRQIFGADDRRACWLNFEDLRRASVETAHQLLVDQLLEPEALYVAGVALDGTDDALRLLRLIDDLYVAPDAPMLFFSAPAPPEKWFVAEEQKGLARSVAEKFTRTASRLRELCAVRHVEAASAA